MLNLNRNNNDRKTKKKNNKKNHAMANLNPGYMVSKSTKISTTLWRPMQFSDKNNQYMLKL